MLDRKTKELIALALGIATQCDGRIAYDARDLGRAGAACQEIAEAVGIAIQMGGVPNVNYATDALRGFDQLSESKA